MVWLIITPMRWGFRKDLPNWFLCSGTMRFPDPMCLFPIPTAFPRPNSWKKPFSAPHPVPLFELGRCAEPCVLMPAPIPSACFSIRSSLFNFHFPKSPQGLFFILHMDVNVLTMYFFCFGSMPVSFIGTEKKPLAGFLGKLTVRRPYAIIKQNKLGGFDMSFQLETPRLLLRETTPDDYIHP